MKILAVENAVPDTVFTNEASIDRMIAASKPHLSADELQLATGIIQSTFEAANAETRHIANENEQPLDFVVDAAERALASAGVSAKDLDFILFGGVTRAEARRDAS